MHLDIVHVTILNLIVAFLFNFSKQETFGDSFDSEKDKKAKSNEMTLQQITFTVRITLDWVFFTV